MKLKDSTNYFKVEQKRQELIDRCPLDCSIRQRAQCGQFGLLPKYCARNRRKLKEYIENNLNFIK